MNVPREGRWARQHNAKDQRRGKRSERSLKRPIRRGGSDIPAEKYVAGNIGSNSSLRLVKTSDYRAERLQKLVRTQARYRLREVRCEGRERVRSGRLRRPKADTAARERAEASERTNWVGDYLDLARPTAWGSRAAR